ncbi:hypothetical protein DFH09DRAFT_1190419 [Mycena vulgaris]|nr:hypothetical protein DFH09DRAFT_1190419 [Mycena vulgaris]
MWPCGYSPREMALVEQASCSTTHSVLWDRPCVGRWLARVALRMWRARSARIERASSPFCWRGNVRDSSRYVLLTVLLHVSPALERKDVNSTIVSGPCGASPSVAEGAGCVLKSRWDSPVRVGALSPSCVNEGILQRFHFTSERTSSFSSLRSARRSFGTAV